MQESAPEREELKRDLLAAASRAAGPEVIIASSTSGLLPTRLQCRRTWPSLSDSRSAIPSTRSTCCRGLSALQQGAVLASVSFTFVLVGIVWCLVKALREEDVPTRAPVTAAPLRTASPGPIPDER